MIPTMKKSLVLLVALVFSLAVASLARAELTAQGDLFIRFDGGISPNTLPRAEPAPIAVRIEGTIRSATRQNPPPLRRIKIALNRGGKFSTVGLPICRRPEIDPANPSEALATCGDAFVGGGGYTAIESLGDQPPKVFRGEVLLFNSKENGRQTILGHVYQAKPIPLDGTIVFHVSHSSGTYGTIVTGQVPESINGEGYLTSIFLQLQRRYSFRGRARSYLTASCPAPAGFTKAIFPFAQTSMSFEDGRTLSSTLTRTCSVR
jgi:hypothetical protein